MSHVTFKPWRGVPKTGCYECDGPSDFHISGWLGEMRLRRQPDGTFHGQLQAAVHAFACAEHHASVKDHLLNTYGDGSGSSMPTEVTWRAWIFSLWYRPKNRVRRMRSAYRARRR